jgi:hypothetical protein
MNEFINFLMQILSLKFDQLKLVIFVSFILLLWLINNNELVKLITILIVA